MVLKKYRLVFFSDRYKDSLTEVEANVQRQMTIEIADDLIVAHRCEM